MPIISVEITKTIDEREMQKNKRKTNTERSKGNRSYRERERAKWLCCAFKLGFLQLICKASLILMSNLELEFQLFWNKENYMSQSMLQ